MLHLIHVISIGRDYQRMVVKENQTKLTIYIKLSVN